MEFFGRNIRKLGYHFYLVFAIGILAGCGKREPPSVSVAEEQRSLMPTLIRISMSSSRTV